ncbi:flagellar protein FlaG [Halomonas sp.]|uniref:flagellar protein FlaG n=1 Tax=Halomonas sp. TaxID=1486246 RepID=UPI00298EA59A|nr:flagellar protein FlaG [Halomonas sp.]MDW7745231.1 flagellar protein FlaG [Halomonas sp.]
MTSPLTDATLALLFNRPTQELTPHQRLESVMEQLPPAGGVVSEGGSGDDSLGQASLVEPLQRINEAMRAFGLEFELSEENQRPITRIVDRDSGETIRQIPSEEVLRVAERIEELKGRLIRLEA